MWCRMEKLKFAVNINNKVIMYIMAMTVGILSSIDVLQKYILIIGIVSFCIVIILSNLKIKSMIEVFMLLACIDISPIVISGSYIRIYQLLSLVFIIKVIYKKCVLKISNKTNIDKVIYLWVISYFLALPNLISKNDFIAVLFGQILLILIYKSVLYECNKDNILKCERCFFIGMVIIALIGIVQTMLYVFGIRIGISHENVIGIPRPSSLMREPDWYGFICMISSIYFFISIVEKKIIFSKKIDLISFIISIVGLIVSMTRTTWIGFIIFSIIYFIFFTSLRSKIRMSVFLGSCLICCIVGLSILNGINSSLYHNIIDRINPKTSTESDSGAFNSRVYSLRIMGDYIKLHPIVGNGVGSMNKISKDKQILKSYGIEGQINNGRGNANIYITNMFDTGIIGTIFLVLFNIIYIKDMIYLYLKTKKVEFLRYVFCFIGALIVFQMNNGIRFGFIWILMAISMKRYNLEMNTIQNI